MGHNLPEYTNKIAVETFDYWKEHSPFGKNLKPTKFKEALHLVFWYNLHGIQTERVMIVKGAFDKAKFSSYYRRGRVVSHIMRVI